MWSGMTRAGIRRAIQSSARASGRASRKVFSVVVRVSC